MPRPSTTLFDEVVTQFKNRKFAAGLLIAFIDFYTALDVPDLGFTSFEELLVKFPRQSQTSAGRSANTLIVLRSDGTTLSLRPFYNKAEAYFRNEMKRFDYPSCAPHATQAWGDYTGWLNLLLKLNLVELSKLAGRIKKFVLEALPSQEFVPGSVPLESPLFRLLLEGFSFTAPPKEPTGAAFQGVVFGFLRADNPHLQIEIDKVRTGSKRLQRIGDIDAWEGDRLAISAEVKSLQLDGPAVKKIAAFANACQTRGAIAIVAALDFKPEAVSVAESMGLSALSLAEMAAAVRLWDPMKQRTAISSFIYYARHVEKNSTLATRLDAFLAEIQPRI